jgi:hypothetical protein
MIPCLLNFTSTKVQIIIINVHELTLQIVNTISAEEDQLDIVESIIQYSKGFICGESTGVVCLYEKQESGEFHYKKVQLIKMCILFIIKFEYRSKL